MRQIKGKKEPAPLLPEDAASNDPELDRKSGVLRVNAIHWEDGPVPIEGQLFELFARCAAWTRETEGAFRMAPPFEITPPARTANRPPTVEEA